MFFFFADIERISNALVSGWLKLTLLGYGQSNRTERVQLSKGELPKGPFDLGMRLLIRHSKLVVFVYERALERLELEPEN